MKSNTIILSLIGGAALLAGLHHGDVYRDEYRSREDCERDWDSQPAQCETAGGGSSGGGRYWGPSYERDARPVTRHPELRQSISMVKRGGFGRSGARFGGGG